MTWKPFEKFGTGFPFHILVLFSTQLDLYFTRMSVIYNFSGKGKEELTLSIGELVRIEEQYNGWYRGHSVSSGRFNLLFVLFLFRIRFAVLKVSLQRNEGNLS